MNQTVAAGFVWQLVVLLALAYWSRYGVAAVIDAATRRPRAVQWGAIPALGPTPSPSRYKWVVGVLGLAILPVGTTLAAVSAVWRIADGTWPPSPLITAGWVLALAGCFALVTAGEISTAHDNGPGATIRAAAHRSRHRSMTEGTNR